MVHSWEPFHPVCSYQYIEGGRRFPGSRQVLATLPGIPGKPEFPAPQPEVTAFQCQPGPAGRRGKQSTFKGLSPAPVNQQMAGAWLGKLQCWYQLPLRGVWLDTGRFSATHFCQESQLLGLWMAGSNSAAAVPHPSERLSSPFLLMLHHCLWLSYTPPCPRTDG